MVVFLRVLQKNITAIIIKNKQSVFNLLQSDKTVIVRVPDKFYLKSSNTNTQCIPFLTFFLSRGGSLRALMTREAAEGTTAIVACLFWIVNETVILSPFQSEVALAMSSPTFFGDCTQNKQQQFSARYTSRQPNNNNIYVKKLSVMHLILNSRRWGLQILAILC